jgi:hypothetical protein
LRAFVELDKLSCPSGTEWATMIGLASGSKLICLVGPFIFGCPSLSLMTKVKPIRNTYVRTYLVAQIWTTIHYSPITSSFNFTYKYSQISVILRNFINKQNHNKR